MSGPEYGEAFRFTAEERGSRGCCIVCGSYCGAYYCVDCSINSHYEGARVNASSMAGSSPTACGRALQRRVDAAAEYEQLQQLWSCVDSTVEIYADIEDVRASRSVRALRLGIDRRRKLRPYTLGGGHKIQRWLRMWERIGARAARDLAPAWKL